MDDVIHTGPVNFFWPVGSKHTLEALPNQFGGSTTVRYAFQGWRDTTGVVNVTSPVLVIHADLAVTEIKAVALLEYAIQLNFYDCAQPPDLPCPGSPGTLFVNSIPFQRNAVVWAVAGSSASIQANANPGYVFTGWQSTIGMPNAFARNIKVDGPLSLSPRFEPGKRMTFKTVPVGGTEELELQVLADRSPVLAPASLDWADGTQHVVAALSPQTDKHGRHWIFDSFDIGPQNSVYTVSQTNVPKTITAKFTPAAWFSFLTNPTGLKLAIDGRDNWASHNFVWGLYSLHHVSAPAQTTDARGRRYVFRGWSNGGEATQDIEVTKDMLPGFRITAAYELMHRVTIISNPPGVTIQADGAACRTPCRIDREKGSTARVTVPPAISVADGTRLEFADWHDSPAIDRVFDFSRDEQTVLVNYTHSYRLMAVAEPSGASGFRIDPPSADGFYRDGERVMVTAEAAPGFRFVRWDGDVTGSFRSTMLAMSSPRLVRAVFDRVPFIHPAGVRNAAASSIENVTAGSLIAIFGANLASESEVGPTNPMAQTLAGVVARIDNRLLPLISVTPELINTQLPWDLPEGNYRVAIRYAGQPEVFGDFTVVRNAPGLFTRAVEGRDFVSALHEDGSEVTIESPARRGETITLLGTGHGPLDRRPPDGFPVPEAPDYRVEDLVEVFAGDRALETVWSGAMSGQLGLIGVRVKVTDDLPAASAVELRVRVNGRDSNAALLPIE